MDRLVKVEVPETTGFFFSRPTSILTPQCLHFQTVINHIRASSHSASYATSMPAPVTQQVISSMRQIMGLEGGSEGIPCLWLFHLRWNGSKNRNM